VSANKPYDVFGVGNALVDILAHINDAFVDKFGFKKGSMTLMDAATQGQILQHLEMSSLQLASGGSAANTMVNIAQSGGKGIYCGKVAHDTYGEFYRRDMQQAGISFPVVPAPEAGLPTGTCVVLTTPDAERTMCTHLGVSTSLTKSDLALDQLAHCKLSYVEGYLWDAPHPREACVETFEQSRRLGVRTSFTFSDAFLVNRFPDDFRRIVRDYCDIVFCNADEAYRYCENDQLSQCVAEIGTQVGLAFVTNSADGCYVAENGVITHVPGFSTQAIDTVGAGDAFAGGVLYGLSQGWPAIKSARWGNYLASRVVAKVGPRLSESLAGDMAKVLS
jgi:sugar/nucleoside kinase (ribokinase family)